MAQVLMTDVYSPTQDAIREEERKGEEKFVASLGRVEELLSVVESKGKETKKVSLEPSATNELSYDSHVIADIMIFLQLFESAIAKAQSQRDQMDANIGQDRIASAVKDQENVMQQIQEAIAAEAAAHNRPWWETFVQVVVSVVAVIAAAFTGGVGAGFAALAVAAFMASPAYSEAVNGISSAVASALVQYYKSEGYSDEDAKAKASAVGNIIAKIVVAVVIAIVTAGVAGAASSGEGVAAGAGTGAADAAEGGIMKSITSLLSRAFSVLKAGGKVGAFEGLSSLASSGIWMDGMMTNPEWVRSHQKEVMALSILAAIVSLIITVLGAKVAFKSGVASGVKETLLERFPMVAKGLIPANYVGQIVGGGVEGGLTIARMEYLKKEADFLKAVGLAQYDLTLQMTAVDMINQGQKSADRDSTDNISSITSLMSEVGEFAGVEWETAASTLLRG